MVSVAPTDSPLYTSFSSITSFNDQNCNFQLVLELSKGKVKFTFNLKGIFSAPALDQDDERGIFIAAKISFPKQAEGEDQTSY